MIAGQRFTSRPDGSIYASSENWAWLVAMVSAKARNDAARNGGFSTLALDFINAASVAAQVQAVDLGQVPTTEPDTAGTGIIEVSAAQAAEMRGCSTEMIRRMCRKRQIPARRTGRNWLIEAEYLNKQTTGNNHYGY